MSQKPLRTPTKYPAFSTNCGAISREQNTASVPSTAGSPFPPLLVQTVKPSFRSPFASPTQNSLDKSARVLENGDNTTVFPGCKCFSWKMASSFESTLGSRGCSGFTSSGSPNTNFRNNSVNSKPLYPRNHSNGFVWIWYQESFNNVMFTFSGQSMWYWIRQAHSIFLLNTTTFLIPNSLATFSQALVITRKT